MFLKFSEQIAKDDVFAHLDTRAHEKLAQLAFHASYRKGQYICMQDDIWKRALYVSSGKLGWVMLAPDGKRQVVFRMGPGRVVWGHSLFDGEPMPAALEVMEDCEVCMWEGDAIIPIISCNVDAVWAVTRILVATMRRVRDVVYGFAFHPVAGRLAHLLLNHYKPVEGQATPRDLTLDEMAHTVGSTRELVSKTLHQFAGEGMIEISRVEITFTDRSKLEQLLNE
ncbi:MAG: Crp/Fnr family transcriptional regulator [Anaerolineae bacterium]|jgi:CRP-like cAMP-binding protein|nr:Crp/Fnr family transcriptional regulator [Anaerolineae bacterium]MBT7188730.1 Crp/Fnr family transcriptional regulator [Anaerolineae bacterium]MBT7600211.1 Crp/Fnr family transcriptional regulator [Anaerolineae bacterium]MBT7991251.1 Crp/Fnr family transcriptional regulator [Anaerolineae bacterium]